MRDDLRKVYNNTIDKKTILNFRGIKIKEYIYNN